MKPLNPIQSDTIAAICYLALFQISEMPSPQLKGEPFIAILAYLDYPTDPIFDNEGEPIITWKSGTFNNTDPEIGVYYDIPSIFNPPK